MEARLCHAKVLSVTVAGLALFYVCLRGAGTSSGRTLQRYLVGPGPFGRMGSLGQCEPALHVVFVKIHKAGSSTVFNLFMRYAAQNLLTVAMPRKQDVFHLGLPSLFAPQVVQDLSSANMSTNLVTMHTRFHHSSLLRLMPRGAHTRFVTIMRQPADMFASLYRYYGLKRKFNASLEEFVKTKALTVELKRNRFSATLGFNQIAFDLGLNPREFDDPKAVGNLIERVNRTFDLVMIAERFAESLILLRHKLCLPLHSVVAFRKNASPESQPLSRDLRRDLNALSSVDARLYAFFAAKLEKEIEKFGKQTMKNEVKLLKQITDSWYARCVDRESGARVRVQKIKSEREDDEICRWLTYDELQFSREIRQVQVRRARMLTGRFYA